MIEPIITEDEFRDLGFVKLGNTWFKPVKGTGLYLKCEDPRLGIYMEDIDREVVRKGMTSLDVRRLFVCIFGLNFEDRIK